MRISAAAVTLAVLGSMLGQSAQAAPNGDSSTDNATRHIAPAANVCPQNPEPGYATCLAERRTDIAPRARTDFGATAVPSGFAPVDLKSAYNIPVPAITPTTPGSGPTVAIVDAYDNPSAEADLAVYRGQYGLASCTSANGCFRKVNQRGSTTGLPQRDSGWASEIALDLQMVSATCPACKILLVEADSNYFDDFGKAERYAATQGVRAISNSYGGSEENGDQQFGNQNYNFPGIAVTASSGDEGYGTQFPASVPNVIAVGGTALTRNPTNAPRGWSESAWGSGNSNGAGSGCSTQQPKPTWQSSQPSLTGCNHRIIADVSAVADPATGVAVYDSYGSHGWVVFGGTSVAAPIIAAMYALANPTTATNPSPASLYAAPSNSLNDVTTGQNASSCSPSYLCMARPGYDGPTGNGTPYGLAALGGPATPPPPPSAFSLAVAPTSGSLARGGTTTATVTNTTTTAPAQTAVLSISGLPTGVTASFSPASASPGAPATLTLTASTTATLGGPSNLTITGTGPSSTATAAYGLTVVASSTCPIANQLGNPGFETAGTPWTASSGVIGANTGTGAPRTGTRDAWLDGYGRTHTDTLSQTITVPTGCTHGTLTFYLKINTSETTQSTKYDTLKVMFGSTTLTTYSNLDHTSGYQLFTLPLSGLTAGSYVLTFTGAEDNAYQTSFVIDDTSLTLAP